MLECLETRVEYPPWLRHSSEHTSPLLLDEDPKVGFFSPRDEAYRPLGKLVSVRPLVTAITQRFACDSDQPSPVRLAETSRPIDLMPETRAGPRGSVLQQKFAVERDTSGKVLKEEIRKSQWRLVEAKSGVGLMTVFRDRVDVREQVKALKSGNREDLQTAEPLSELKKERTRSLAAKLSFYDESRKL